MTAAGTGSVTLAIQGKDQASGKYYTLLAGPGGPGGPPGPRGPGAEARGREQDLFAGL